jgi:transposase
MGRGDLTDEQWLVLEPLLPKGTKAGRPPIWSRRQLIDGIRFRVRTGVPWRDVPAEYGPWGRIYDLFRRWQRNGTWHRVFSQLQSLADAKGAITWDLSVDSTVCRALSMRPGPGRRVACRRNRRAVSSPSLDHGLGRSRGGFTTKLHLAVEQGQKPMSIVVTAGQRGDSPQFERVLEKVRVPRIGAGRPRVRPDRVRADKAYASRKNRAYLRRRGIRCTIPDKADQARNRRNLGSRGGRPPHFDPWTTVSATRSSAGSTASRGTALSPRDTTNSRSATRRPSSSRPSTSGCDHRPFVSGPQLRLVLLCRCVAGHGRPPNSQYHRLFLREP